MTVFVTAPPRYSRARHCHGAVYAECQPRYGHQESLPFLRRLGTCITESLEVHLIVDNYATHKHAKVRRVG
jgi:putative transposase